MDRYSLYFLQHALWLDDGFHQYYVQGIFDCPGTIQEVETQSFVCENEAEAWLWRCLEFDQYFTIDRLRSFLVEHSPQYYHVHLMDDKQVIQTAALVLIVYPFKIVKKKKIEDAFQTSEFDTLLSEIKKTLNDIIRDQKQKYQDYETQLAEMSEDERVAAYGKKAGKGSIVNPAKDFFELVKSLPGLWVSNVKLGYRVITTPARFGVATFKSMVTTSPAPLVQEYHSTFDPLNNVRDEIIDTTTTVYILLSDESTRIMLTDFAEQYWQYTHPLQRTELAANAVSDIIISIILALVSGGVGAAANIMSKTRHLTKIAALLEKLAKLLRIMAPRRILPKKKIGGGAGAVAKGAPGRVKKAGVPEVKSPAKVDGTGKKPYDGDSDCKGPKRTPKITGDKGTTVNVDGHKIYDPSHPPLSSNPKAQYRFSDPSYRSTGGDVYFGENVGTSFHEVRKNIKGKSLYVGEVRVDNVLDLTDPDVVRKMNIDPAKLTAKVDDVIAQKKVYGYTNKIANQAYDAGYSGIVYPSSRKAGSKAVALFDGRYDPKSIKQILDVSIP